MIEYLQNIWTWFNSPLDSIGVVILVGIGVGAVIVLTTVRTDF